MRELKLSDRRIRYPALPLWTPCGMIAPTEIEVAGNAAQGGLYEANSHRRFRQRAGDVGDIGAGASKASAQARRHPRYAEPLFRHPRRRPRDVVEDGGGGVLRHGAEPS